jgi:hypothetical protein
LVKRKARLETRPILLALDSVNQRPPSSPATMSATPLDSSRVTMRSTVPAWLTRPMVPEVVVNQRLSSGPRVMNWGASSSRMPNRSRARRRGHAADLKELAVGEPQRVVGLTVARERLTPGNSNTCFYRPS